MDRPELIRTPAGKRTTGTDAKDFVVTGPGYTGELPADIPLVAAPTPHVWIVGRTQPTARRTMTRSTRSRMATGSPRWASTPEHVIDADYDTSTEPLKTVNSMSAVDFFAYAAELLAVNPPHPTDEV